MTSAQRRKRLRELREKLRWCQMHARMAASELEGWRKKARKYGQAMSTVRYGK